MKLRVDVGLVFDDSMAKPKSKRGRKRRQDEATPWVERPLFIAQLRRLTGKRFIKWSRLVEEADALRTQVRSHRVQWPPTSAESQCLATGLPSAVPLVDPMSPAVAGELPSMRALFGTAIARLAAGQVPADARAQQQFTQALTTTYHGLLVWREHSRHVLRVNPILLDDFAHGEPATLTGAELFLGVPALYVELPRGITMVDPLDQSKRLNVRGALITVEHEDGEHYSRRELRVALIGRRKRRWPPKTDPILAFRIGLDNRSLAHPRVVPSDIAASVHVPADLVRAAGREGDPSRGEPGLPAPNDIVTILLRLLDYLMSNPEDKRRRRVARSLGAGRHDRATKGRHAITSAYWTVGGYHARSPNAGGWRHGKPLAYLVHVRAHMRNQAWGPGFAFRRRMKISRHVRGLRHADTLHTTIQSLNRPDD